VPAGSRVLLLLNDSLGLCPFVIRLRLSGRSSLPTRCGLEWLVADLALAHFSVPTITLTSSVLLNQVLESHPPNAIIVDASFLERVLELMVESLSDVVVVVVNDKKGELKRLKNETRSRLVPWEDLESFDGAAPSVAQPGW
jgi:long-chain acyl-CoA synthetase